MYMTENSKGMKVFTQKSGSPSHSTDTPEEVG